MDDLTILSAKKVELLKLYNNNSPESYGTYVLTGEKSEDGYFTHYMQRDAFCPLKTAPLCTHFEPMCFEHADKMASSMITNLGERCQVVGLKDAVINDLRKINPVIYTEERRLKAIEENRKHD